MKRLFAAMLVLAALGAAAAAVTVYRRIAEPYKGYGTAEQFVEIAPGSSTRAIGNRLVEAGVVRDRTTFRAALWRTGVARALKAGTYRFDRPMSAAEVLEKIARGDIWLRRITFPEGLNVIEMSRIFEQQHFGSAAAFIDAARRPELVASIDASAGDLEGYLFPETYALAPNAGAEALVRMMVGRFEQVFTPDMRNAAAAAGLTVRQTVTLASIVEKETGAPAERPVIAAVYLNRLRIGMPLQCDPTVIYALQKAGRYNGNIRRADLDIESPYNTYRYAGMPPGPIASPGLASLQAVVAPGKVDYLYFVSRNDGSHVFSRTLDEHNANVRKFQVEFFRRR